MQFCMDIHCVMSINPADFIDPLTFPLVFPLAITVLMYLMRYLDIDGFAKKKSFLQIFMLLRALTPMTLGPETVPLVP